MPRTALPKASKPPKPYPDFPLCAHPNGRWTKKIKGRLVYFTKWSEDRDGSQALAQYLEERDDLHAGRRPRGKTGELSLADGLNAFLSAKLLAKQAGDIGPRMYGHYQDVCDVIAQSIGKHRQLSDIDAQDLEKLRSALTQGKRGPLNATTLKAMLGRCRSVFLYANEALGQAIRYRRPLASPSRRVMRQAANRVGPRMFSRDELRTIINAATPTMRAWVYLGINCAFGPLDCSLFPVDKLDLDGGWHTYARNKNYNDRRAKLWPETVAAIRAIMGDGPLVFSTDPTEITRQFRKLLKRLKMYRKGVTVFYSLRRTFETVGQSCGEQVAVNYVMGHCDKANDMQSLYRQKVYDAQLLKVSEHIRGWLNGSISLD